MAAHGRRLRGAVGLDPRGAPRGDEGSATSGHPGLVRSQLPRFAVALRRRQGAGARGEPIAHALRRRPLRQRGRPLGRPRLRGRRGGRGVPPAADRGLPRRHRRGAARVPEPRRGGDDAADGALRVEQRLGGDRVDGRGVRRGRAARGRDPRSRRRRRLVRVGLRLRFAVRASRWPGRSSAASPTARWRCRRPATPAWPR